MFPPFLCEETAGAVRFWMLETIREYCWEKLVALGEEEVRQVRGRHLEFFTRLAEQAHEKWASAEQGMWWDRLEAEHDNLRAALEWGIGSDPIKALHLAPLLFRFWERRGHITEGRAWVARVLARTPDAPPALRAGAFRLAAGLARWQNDYAQAVTCGEEALRLYRQVGNEKEVAATLNSLAYYAQDLGDFERARALYEEALQIAHRLDITVLIANVLNHLGEIAFYEGDNERASALHEESLSLHRGIGNTVGIAWSLACLGDVAATQDNDERARALLEESLRLTRTVGFKSGVARALHRLTGVACRQGDYGQARALNADSLAIRRELGNRNGIAENLDRAAMLASAKSQNVDRRAATESVTASREAERAVMLFAAAAALRESIGVAPPRCDRDERNACLAAARAVLGDKAFAAAWAKGRALTLKQVAAYALNDTAE